MSGTISLTDRLQLERGMQRTRGVHSLALLDDARDPDLRCGDHLDINLFIAECLEYSGGDPWPPIHTCADDRDLGQAASGLDDGRPTLEGRRPNHLQCLRKHRLVNDEGDVRPL